MSTTRRAYAESVHRLAHEHGSCLCDYVPSDPTPDREALRRSFGQKALAAARAAGLDMPEPTDEELIALGDSELAAYKELVLERLRAINAGHREQARAMEWQPGQTLRGHTEAQAGEAKRPSETGSGGSRGVDAGQVDLHSAEVSETPDRNVIIDRDDENEEWSPL
jgi:hypothetical protein